VVGLDPGEDAIDLAARSHHAPDMLDRLGLIELDKTGAGNRMDCVSCRIGHQVQMKPGQRHPSLAPISVCSTLWINDLRAGTTPGFFRPMILVPGPGIFARLLSTALAPLSSYPVNPGMSARHACFPDFILVQPAS